MSDPRFTANPAWAIQYPDSVGIASWSIRETETEAQDDFARVRRDTWASLYRRGYRVVKVWLRTEAGDG